MKKILLILLGAVVLVIAGLVSYVSMIDWNEHKGRIAASLSELTGKKVVFSGPISVSLFPSPQLIASQVQVFNSKGEYADKPLVNVAELSAKVSFSSLFGGDFDISRVSLKEPEINFEFASDGTLNWVEGGQKFQEDNIRQMQVSLDSVTLENAKLHFIYPQMKIDSVLSNLNAEVIAETVFGPYRIEGSYTKGENPEGFAVSIGQIAENIATSINLAVNFPATKSFVRFDGTVYFRDRKVLGNVIAESDQPVDFVRDMFNINLDGNLNQKFALTAAIDSGLEKMSLSNFVIKYGKTSGAGNVLIPLPVEQDSVYYPTVELAFNMTDLDLDLPMLLLKKSLKDYPAVSVPSLDFGFNLIGDIKALKSYCNNQTINDLDLSFDLKNGKFFVRSLKGTMFDDTAFNLTGSVDVRDGVLGFDAKPSFETSEFSRLLEWVGYSPAQVAPATYQKASAEASVKGTGNQIYISSLAFLIDNILFSGDAGIVVGDQIDSMWVINATNINFDNYIAPVADSDAQKTFSQKLGLFFKELAFMNSHNFNLVFNLDKGIFRSVPFEGLKADFQLSGGKMSVNRFEIGNLENSSLILSGMVSGFGNEPAVEGLQYDFNSKDFGSLAEKIHLFDAPTFFSKTKLLSSKGVVSGTLQYAALRSESSFDKNVVNYSGVVDFSSGMPVWDGNIELQSSDFVKMLNEFGVAYAPQAFSLGLFNVKSDIKGSVDNFNAQNVVLNIGANNFSGSVGYDVTSGRPKVTLNGKINRLESNRFLPESKVKTQTSFQNNTGVVNFLNKPIWSKVPFNLVPLTKVDIFADLSVDEFLWQNLKLLSTDVKFTLDSGKLSLQSFEGDYANGKVSAKGELAVGVVPEISFNLSGKNIVLSSLNLGGKVFAVRDGNLNFNFNARSVLSSEYDFFEGLNGILSFDVTNSNIRGWNFWNIKSDIAKRTTSSGLKDVVSQNLQNGSTLFDNIKGNIKFEKGAYMAENISFDNSLASLSAKVDGNFMTWDVNAAFNVSWKEKLSPFSFSWSGGLETPQVNADVSVLTNEFDTRNAQIEAEKKAKEKELQDALKSRFDEQMAQYQKLKKDFSTSLLPQFDAAFKMVEGNSFKRSFSALKKKIDASSGLLDEISALVLSPQISEKLISSLAEKNKKIAEALPTYYKELADLSLAEAKQRLENYHDGLVKSYEVVVAQKDDFQKSFQAFAPRLAASESLVTPESDDEIRELTQSFEAVMAELSDLQKKSSDAYELVVSQNDKGVVERVVVILKDNKAKLESEQQKLADLSAKILEKAEKITVAEEQAALLRRQEAERQKKVEEATGMIANADGQVKTIVPDINKIEQAEEEIVQEKRKVLDFSSDKERSDSKLLSVPVGDSSGHGVSGVISRD